MFAKLCVVSATPCVVLGTSGFVYFVPWHRHVLCMVFTLILQFRFFNGKHIFNVSKTLLCCKHLNNSWGRRGIACLSPSMVANVSNLNYDLLFLLKICFLSLVAAFPFAILPQPPSGWLIRYHVIKWSVLIGRKICLAQPDWSPGCAKKALKNDFK